MFRSLSFRFLVCVFLIFFNDPAVYALDIYNQDSVTHVRNPENAQQYSLSVSQSFQAVQGKFDAYNNYNPYPDGSDVMRFTTLFSVEYQWTEDFDTTFSFSVSHSVADYPSGSSTSDSVGNPSFQLGYKIGGWPDLHMKVGLTTGLNWTHRNTIGDPSKDSSVGSDESSSDLGSGAGGAGVNLGLTGSHAFAPFKLIFSAGMGLPFGQQVTPDWPVGSPSFNLRKGVQLQLGESVGYLLSRDWSTRLGFNQKWSSDSMVDGIDAVGTASRRFTTSFGLTYVAGPQWRMVGSFETPWPFYDYAVNTPYAPTVGLGLTYIGI